MKTWKLCKGLSEQACKDKCFEVYVANYVKDENGQRLVFKTVDEIQVFFSEHTFWHAFFTGEGDNRFDYRRARRILWIGEALRETSGFCRVDEEGDRRLYFHEGRRYVVVLKRFRKRFNFITHYVLDEKKKFRRMQNKFERKKPLFYCPSGFFLSNF